MIFPKSAETKLPLTLNITDTFLSDSFTGAGGVLEQKLIELLALYSFERSEQEAIEILKEKDLYDALIEDFQEKRNEMNRDAGVC